MAHVFDLRRNIDLDDFELGLRVACALFAENETEPANFIRVLKLRHRWVEDIRKARRMEETCRKAGGCDHTHMEL